ncbi:MAG: YkgJ family cysteine cluster protein [Ilumatobacteraceae bacterium]
MSRIPDQRLPPDDSVPAGGVVAPTGAASPGGGAAPAGRVTEWLDDFRGRRTSAGGPGADVPCGDCVACCRSAYFIHVGPDEHEARRAIPAGLLVAAPGLPPGHHVIGFDRAGRCPLLSDSGCTIYDARPATCRDFDCRVFAATAVVPSEPAKVELRRRTERWAFDVSAPADRDRLAAMRAAARFLEAHPECFDPPLDLNSTQLALAALHVHDLFLERDETRDPAEAVSRVRDRLRS